MASSDPTARPGAAPHGTLHEYYGEDAKRPEFVQHLFDHTAPSYDRMEAMVGLGSGPWYRNEALKRAGLVSGMRVLDVAIGTGLVAREAIKLIGDSRLLIGLDPSPGMLLEARRNLKIAGVRAYGEAQPLKNESFDFLSMGYALRHLSDLVVTFREFFRVLKPGGRLCILELTPPPNRMTRALLRFYLKGIVPPLARVVSGTRDGKVLMEYFWDTMQACVPPPSILAALHEVGFVVGRRSLAIGIFSEYTAYKPGPGVPEVTEADSRLTGNFALKVFPVYRPNVAQPIG
jgi:demethylmenaquinone methyltransferase / 2-methoxy-6-polyprenyl-1,4-benzoquinol methylase